MRILKMLTGKFWRSCVLSWLAAQKGFFCAADIRESGQYALIFIAAVSLAQQGIAQEEPAPIPKAASTAEILEQDGATEVQVVQAGGHVTADSSYELRLNAALRESRDAWGEALIAQGGATFDTIAGALRPLFFATGRDASDLAVHNLLFANDGGEPPYIVPLADGSRIAATVRQSEEYIAWRVGEAREPFGSDLARLEGPTLAEGWRPVLQTAYTDGAGNRFEQTSHAEAGLAYIEMKITAGEAGAALALDFGATARSRFNFTVEEGIITRTDTPESLAWHVDAGVHTLRCVWSPVATLPEGTAPWPEAKPRGTAFDTTLAQLNRFQVPERRVMDAQRNLLIQNLIMRWRYSLGSCVYHGKFYQPESSDAVQTLGEYGHPDAHRDGLAALITMSKGAGQYTNWEMGEKLSHAAHYYFLTRDAGFVAEHTDTWIAMCEEFRTQIETDPHGLLAPQRLSGDIANEEYYIHHLAVCWRGLRDMAEVWQAEGRDDLHARFRPIADRLKAGMDLGLAEDSITLNDETRFVPRALFGDRTLFDPITETRDGSYWNLVMPYAFASGFWPMDGPELGRITRFMHEHGGLFLGMLRFNYYPTPIGESRADGYPGYYTTGVDNVYMPAYLRMIAAQDMPERLVLAFYGKLAHGMTRNTFVAGEGDNLGVRPGEFYRSSFGGPCSGNNTVFLQALRLMLVRESFDYDTGVPHGLFLAHATPREWLRDGGEIVVSEAPTCFGAVSYRITPALAEGQVSVELTLPDRNPMAEAKLRLRLPDPHRIAGVSIRGGGAVHFDAATETIDLSGLIGALTLDVATTAPPVLKVDLQHSE